MPKKVIEKLISIFIILTLSLAFVAKFGAPTLLRLYLEFGIGDCARIPILCNSVGPEVAIRVKPQAAEDFLLYKFPRMQARIPRGFDVVQGTKKKLYYKRRSYGFKKPTVYLLYQEPGFFVSLFPQVKKSGVINNYGFVKQVMQARLPEVKGLTSTFFVIMKSIFIPDIGEQKNAVMAQFALPDRKVFLNYTLSPQGNYFDCNVLDNQGGYCKIYIKDKLRRLNLEQVLAIASSAKRQQGGAGTL